MSLPLGMIFAALGAAALLLALLPLPPPAPAQTISGCPVLPADNPWNRDVSQDLLNPNSANYINSILLTRQFLHPDFGSDPTFGIPFVVVPGSQPKVPITFDAFPDESDPGPYPIPPDAPVESGSDGHVLAIDSGACILYELYQARKNPSPDPGWTASSGARFDLRSNALRPEGFTSADAAGLPIFPGLVRFDEVTAGVIPHALRFTVARTQRAYIHPATHFAGATNDPNFPPMGLRLRLKSSFNVSGFSGQSRVVLNALQKYGMMVADNGSSWFISGARDSRWNDNDLNQLKTVPGSAFEVVDTGPLLGQVTPTPIGSATAIASATPTLTPASACTPRPPVAVTVAPSGVGRLAVTLTTQGPSVRLLSLAFGNATNALVDAGTLTGATGSFTVTLPAGTTTTSFFVRQATAGQATTVPLTVNDTCGAWPTFVGGGPLAFGGPAGPAAPPVAGGTGTGLVVVPTGTPTPQASGQPAPAAIIAATGVAASAPSPNSSGAEGEPAAICTPRPPVGIATAPTGDGRLRVTITAPAAAHATLQALRVTSTTNALVDTAVSPIAGGSQTGATGSFSVSLAPGTREATLYVRRAAPSQPSTVNVTVVDSCGDWPTVVGGGPGAF